MPYHKIKNSEVPCRNESQEEYKKQLERERILRNIIDNIRSSLDFKKVRKNLVTEVGKYFNASRCFLMQIDQKTLFPYKIDECSEYRRDENVVSAVGYDFKNCKILQEWKKYEPITEDLRLCYTPNIDDYLKMHGLTGSEIDAFFQQQMMKAFVGAPLFYGDKILGSLAIHWDKTGINLSEEDFDFICDIANQTAIALHQTNTLQALKEQLEKEKLLKIDQSIVINKNMALNVGLNAAITYSVIMNEFNCRESQTEKEFIKIPLENLLKSTCLSEINLKEAIYKLYESKIIDFKKISEDIYSFKIEESSEITVAVSEPRTVADNFVNLKNNNESYNDKFSEETLSAVKYYLQRAGQDYSSLSKLYIFTLCKTFNEFFNNYKLEPDAMKTIIDYWFAPEKKENENPVVDFKDNQKLLAKRLKEILLIKLHKTEAFAMDFASKIDFYSATLNSYDDEQE